MRSAFLSLVLLPVTIGVRMLALRNGLPIEYSVAP